MPDPLERELQKYQELLPTLSGSEGKFALIFKGALLGIYEAYPDALTAGYQSAGLEPFLIKRIATTEVISYFTRDVGTACHI